MKSGKAAGLCGINAEMLKAGDSVVVKWLHRIVNIAWATGEVLKDWKRAGIIPQVSKAMCSNYRGISLLSVPGKVYARIVDNRVKQKTEGMILEVQGGFRKGRSCIDQIFTVSQLGEKVLEKGKQMAVACVDLEKAYDTVRRDKLWQVLEEYGIHGRLLGAVREFYKKSEACVKIGEKMSRWFQITRGVRQGCVMSPWLFNVFMDKIVREAQERFTEEVQLETTIVKLVLFTDDVMMLAEKSEDMERNLTEMKKAMDNWGMKIHWGKTNVMMVSRTGDDCKVNVDGQDIAQVEKMKYLGVMLSASGRCDDEIEQRIGAAANVVGAMRKQVLDRRELKKSTKLRVYNAMVLPTLLYGYETWTMQQRHVSSLQALEMRY